ncbi:MAG: hypothetical protein V3S36_02730, partial [Acidiferrobacterales bacterium]
PPPKRQVGRSSRLRGARQGGVVPARRDAGYDGGGVCADRRRILAPTQQAAEKQFFSGLLIRRTL